MLELGARARVTWKPGSRRSIALSGREGGDLPVSREVAEHLVGKRKGTLRVSIEHDLPVGHGLGMSAAGALATGLAVSAAVGGPRQRAIEAAHLADLFGGGGLGGVAAILGGGLEQRTVAGVPPWGRVHHTAYPGSIILIFEGSTLPSRSLLLRSAFRQRASAAALAAIREFSRDPSPGRFWSEAEKFTDDLRLGSASLRRLLRKLRGAGVPVAQAMLGRTLFADSSDADGRRRLVDLLQRSRASAIELRAGSRGAFLFGGSSSAPAQAL